MRIIAGNKRGARLATLDGEDTRPTLERVKEAMFSSVQFLVPGATVLDLFAGSGQMGLEALSRGALRCTFVDSGSDAAQLIKDNCRAVGLLPQCRVVRMDAVAFLAQSKEQFDIVFLDPPYKQGLAANVLPMVAPMVAPAGVVLCETEADAELPAQAGALQLKKQYHYGAVMVSRYEMPRT